MDEDFKNHIQQNIIKLHIYIRKCFIYISKRCSGKQYSKINDSFKFLYQWHSQIKEKEKSNLKELISKLLYEIPVFFCEDGSAFYMHEFLYTTFGRNEGCPLKLFPSVMFRITIQCRKYIVKVFKPIVLILRVEYNGISFRDCNKLFNIQY